MLMHPFLEGFLGTTGHFPGIWKHSRKGMPMVILEFGPRDTHVMSSCESCDSCDIWIWSYMIRWQVKNDVSEIRSHCCGCGHDVDVHLDSPWFTLAMATPWISFWILSEWTPLTLLWQDAGRSCWGRCGVVQTAQRHGTGSAADFYCQGKKHQIYPDMQKDWNASNAKRI